MMYLLVQHTDVMASRQRLQSRWHSMQMSRYSIPLKPRVICFCCVQDLIPRGDVIHLTFHVPWHLADYSTMLIKGHGRPALQCFWNLLCRLYDGLIFASNDLQVFASLLTAWSVGISLPSSSKYLFSQTGQKLSKPCVKGSAQGILTNIIQTSGSSSCL